MGTLEVRLRDLQLNTPVIGASGVFGYGLEYGELIDYTAYGAVVAKTLTLKPREGNPPPRVADVGCGILNSIGLENVGCEAFIADKLPAVHLPCKFFASIGGDTVDEYRQLAALLGGKPGIDAIEINVSCPNVARGCIAFGSDPAATREVVRAVRAETDRPLVAKLPPLFSGLENVAVAACEAGADALVVANTYPGIAIDVEVERPLLGNVSGGLSGRAVRPLSVLLVWKAAEAVRVPIIASGGIEQPEDAIEYMLAGASALEIGSVILRDLGAATKILAGIKAFMDRKSYSTLDDFRGKARKTESMGCQ